MALLLIKSGWVYENGLAEVVPNSLATLTGIQGAPLIRKPSTNVDPNKDH
jgi:hypothetical protein